MRWVHLAVIVLFGVATVIFAVQNLEAVRMSFLGFSISAPLAVIALIVYVLGAISGGSLYELLRKSIQASRS